MKKACIFVDGENFRYSLCDLFGNGRSSFNRNDYLPNTDWHAFFDGLAKKFDCELLRTYWYVVGSVDMRPHTIPHEWVKARALFSRNEVLKARIDKAAAAGKGNDELLKIKNELKEAQKSLEGRAKGWKQIQDTIEHNTDQLEFVRTGNIAYDLLDGSFGNEKGVDTQLATDLIVLTDIYDVAIIVSGDADYMPPIRAIKNRGKLAFGISFLNAAGKQLPGGAWRLDNCLDRQYQVPFEEMRKAMNVSVTQPEPAGTKAAVARPVTP